MRTNKTDISFIAGFGCLAIIVYILLYAAIIALIVSGVIYAAHHIH